MVASRTVSGRDVHVVMTGASGFVPGAVLPVLNRMRGVSVSRVSRRAVPGALQVRTYADAPGGDVLLHFAGQYDELFRSAQTGR